MNTRNNKRSINSQEMIEKAFTELLNTHHTRKITVQTICKLANVNRTTFYTHYADVHDLQNKIEEKLSSQIQEIFKDALYDKTKMNDAFCRMFYFIKEHKAFYKVFLEYHNMSFLKTILKRTEPVANNNVDFTNYHVSFFTAGVSEMVRIWLNSNCREKPEELAQIIYEEYRRV